MQIVRLVPACFEAQAICCLCAASDFQCSGMCSQGMFVNFQVKYFGSSLVAVSKVLMLDECNDYEEQIREK